MANNIASENMKARAEKLTTEEWADLYTAYGDKVAEYASHQARQIRQTWDRTDLDGGDIESETWARLAEKGWSLSEFAVQGIEDEAQRLTILKLLVKTVARTMARRLVGFDYAKDRSQRDERKEIGDNAYEAKGFDRGLAQVVPASFSGSVIGDDLDDGGSYGTYGLDIQEMADPNALDPLQAVIDAEDAEEKDATIADFRTALNAWSVGALAPLTETQRGLFQAYYVDGTLEGLQGNTEKVTLRRGHTRLDEKTINGLRAIRASQGLPLGSASVPSIEDLPEDFVEVLGTFNDRL